MALVKVIEFDIHDFKNHTDEHFVVERNEENYSFISSHRFTRGIEFNTMLSIEFPNKVRIPKFFKERKVREAFESAFSNKDNFLEIDDIDEMTGTF